MIVVDDGFCLVTREMRVRVGWAYMTRRFLKRGQSRVRDSNSPPSPHTLIPYFKACPDVIQRAHLDMY